MSHLHPLIQKVILFYLQQYSNSQVDLLLNPFKINVPRRGFSDLLCILYFLNWNSKLTFVSSFYILQVIY